MIKINAFQLIQPQISALVNGHQCLIFTTDSTLFLILYIVQLLLQVQLLL